MSRLSIGMDPSSTYVGLAALDEEADLVALASVRPKHERRVNSLARDFFEAVAGHRGEVLPERMPQKTKRSSGTRTSGNSGWHIGWWGGRFAGRLECMGYDVLEPVHAGVWRPSMLAWSARNGLVMERPTGRPQHRTVAPARSVEDTMRLSNGGFRVNYRCGHSLDVKDYEELVKTCSNPCSECISSAPQSMNREELVADKWKELACRFVEFHWPQKYAAIVDASRSRAKKQSQPDHHLAGVHDACEAVGLAIHLHVTSVETASTC